MIKKPGAILALLTGLNLLNYTDRLVVSAVLPKIQGELGLSNFVGGLLATVFLLGYFATSPLFGVLGDRMARKGLIAFGVFVWSIATLGSGLVTSAASLIVARAFVGVGEASYGTLAPTIIDDVTPHHRKGRALGIFYFAMPIGAALGYLVGGFVEKHWGWRSAFFVAGGPGVLLALVCLFIEEPPRAPSTNRPDVKRDFARLVSTPLYRKGVLGYCAYTAAVGAFSYWAPKFLYARYGLALSVANFRFGVITVVAGGLATLLGGTLADRMKKRIASEGDSNIDVRACRAAVASESRLARRIHDAISADGRDRSEKGARRIAGPRRTVRTPQVRETPYVLCSKGIGSSEWSRRELSGLGRSARSPRKRTYRTCAGTQRPPEVPPQAGRQRRRRRRSRIDFAQQASEHALGARVNQGLLRICATGSLVGAPLAVACFLSPNPNAFFVGVFFCIFSLFVVTAPINGVVLGSVPPELRASAMALSIFAIHVFGDLWSPPLVGLLADHLPIEIAMMTLPVAIAGSAWIWLSPHPETAGTSIR